MSGTPGGRPDGDDRTPCAYAVGDSFQRRVVIDEAAIRRFATEAGDDNPLHHDSAHAKATRFGGLIASGAHRSALLIGCAASFVTGRAEALGLDFSFSFKRAITAGQTVGLQWRIVDLSPKPSLGGHVAKLEGDLRLESGIVAIAAQGSVVIMQAPLAGQGRQP